MAGSADPTLFKDALLVLGTAGVVVPLMHRLRVSPVLGFLAAGVLLGPRGLGVFVPSLPWLDAVVVTNERAIGLLAELGVVFLLFIVGLELSLARLRTMRRLVFGLGGLQVLVTGVVLGGLATALGLPPAGALVAGLCLALSSTAIVIELLAQQRRTTTHTGRVAFAILLCQDLAVIPLLFVLGILGSRTDGSLATTVLIALGQAALAVGGIYLVGRLLLRPLFRLVAGTGSPELFMAAALFVVIATGAAAAAASLSMALGAFVAGLLLAETEYRRAIETTLEPFKGLLLGVFFFSVGMGVDPALVWRHPVLVLAGAAALVVLKALIVVCLARLWRQPAPVAIEAALLLAPGGEFAFIGVAAATAIDLVPPTTAAILLTMVSVSMASLPALAGIGRRLGERLRRRPDGTPAPPPEPPPGDDQARALVIGYGRVGRLIGEMLGRHGIAWLAIDSAPAVAGRAREGGAPVYYGDVANPLFLDRCGIAHASAVVVTVDAPAAADAIVAAVRQRRPDVTIVARARDADHARHLYAIGVTDTVPETVEASLQLAEAALVDLGIPMGLVIASIHERRDEYRAELRAAADAAPTAAAPVERRSPARRRTPR